MARTHHRRGLTKRERECLKWAARGKSCWATGIILEISEHTVSFHRKRAMSKLGSTTVICTVGRAAAGDLLRLLLNGQTIDEAAVLTWSTEWWGAGTAGILESNTPRPLSAAEAHSEYL